MSPDPLFGAAHDAPMARNFDQDAIDKLVSTVAAARYAVSYSYETGELFESATDEVKRFLEPDGGLLSLLNFANSIATLAKTHKTVPNIALFEQLSICFGVDL